MFPYSLTAFSVPGGKERGTAVDSPLSILFLEGEYQIWLSRLAIIPDYFPIFTPEI